MTGWICPKCGNVYGPHVQACAACNSQNRPVETHPLPKWPRPPLPWTAPNTPSPWEPDRIAPRFPGWTFPPPIIC